MEALINPNGKEEAFEIGLYDFSFRKYSEETGRFLSVDPLLSESGLIGSSRLDCRID
jgi:RHS repeat-associated protein